MSRPPLFCGWCRDSDTPCTMHCMSRLYNLTKTMGTRTSGWKFIFIISGMSIISSIIMCNMIANMYFAMQDNPSPTWQLFVNLIPLVFLATFITIWFYVAIAREQRIGSTEHWWCCCYFNIGKNVDEEMYRRGIWCLLPGVIFMFVSIIMISTMDTADYTKTWTYVATGFEILSLFCCCAWICYMGSAWRYKNIN